MMPASPTRNPWPIAIVACFSVFALFIAGFIAWASRQREDLVAVNYYETEVRYQQQLDRLNVTAPWATQVAVRYDAAQPSIVISLPTAQAQAATGRIHLYRPSDARLDREVPLALNAEGEQRLEARELRAGLWRVRLQWSAGGKEYFAERMVLVASGAQGPSAAGKVRSGPHSLSCSFALQ
jgi:nitrogen fixation protein FixH